LRYVFGIKEDCNGKEPDPSEVCARTIVDFATPERRSRDMIRSKAVSDLTLDKLICSGKLLSPARRRACIEQVRAQLHVSERRACAALGQHRSAQCKVARR